MINIYLFNYHVKSENKHSNKDALSVPFFSVVDENLIVQHLRYQMISGTVSLDFIFTKMVFYKSNP